MGNDTLLRWFTASAYTLALALPQTVMAQEPVQVQRPHAIDPATPPATDDTTTTPTAEVEPTTPPADDVTAPPTTGETTTEATGTADTTASTAETPASNDTAVEDVAIAPFRTAWDETSAEADAAAAAAPITYDLDQDDRKLARAQTMIAAGSVAGVGALVMLIAAGVEHNKPKCMFGLEDCSNAPRPAVATGLAVGGALLLGVGATLIGFGAAKQRRLRMAMGGDRTQVSVAISGRF